MVDRRAYQIAWKRAHPERLKAYSAASERKQTKARRVRRANRKRKLARRDDRKARLVCVVCEAPAVEGVTKCSACTADQRVLIQNLKARRKAEGRCWACGRDAAPFVNCERCRARARDRTQRLAEQGNCSCGFPAREGKRKCQFCVDYIKGYRDKRSAAGLCRRHGNPVLPGRKICPRCVELYRKLQKFNANKKDSQIPQIPRIPQVVVWTDRRPPCSVQTNGPRA